MARSGLFSALEPARMGSKGRRTRSRGRTRTKGGTRTRSRSRG